MLVIMFVSKSKFFLFIVCSLDGEIVFILICVLEIDKF